METKKNYKDELIEFINENKLNDIFVKYNHFLENYNCELYVYFRVSTENQDFGRQIIELYDWAKKKGIKIFIDNIYCDKYTGKTLKRKEYNNLRKLMKMNNYLLISEVSRLGRNWDDTKEEWYRLRDENINKLIMDYDMLSDTLPFEKNIEMTTDRKFVQELIFNAILYVACKKIEEVSKSTKAGLKKALLEGKKIGHPRTEKANLNNFIKTLELITTMNIGQVKATTKTGFPRDTFIRDIKKCYIKYDTKDYDKILQRIRLETVWPL